MQRRKSFNPKRRLISPEMSRLRRNDLNELASRVEYGGNPEHKRNPGDFGLTPPSAGGRPGKTLCDDVGVFTRAQALELLRRGFRAGLVSEQTRKSWPQNVWSVTDEGIPLEGQLESAGVYHGYPMPERDSFRSTILERWSATGG